MKKNHSVIVPSDRVYEVLIALADAGASRVSVATAPAGRYCSIKFSATADVAKAMYRAISAAMKEIR